MRHGILNMRSALMAVLVATLTACSGGEWVTDYPSNLASSETRNWRVTTVDVTVPRSLTTTEDNSFAPNADIVWGEAEVGDRYEQVDRIITDAARRGVSKLRGSRAVVLRIELQTFHALSQRARKRLNSSGVHNVAFIAQIFDAGSGAALTPPSPIRADLLAFVGDQALAAEQQGQTQRVRIVAHVAKVIEGWLGGPDIRGSFSRRGR